MKIVKVFFIAIVLLSGAALNANAQDYPTVAKEYCDCFEKLKDSVDAEFQQVLQRVVKQSNIKTAFQAEMQAMEAGKRVKFAQQLEYIGTSMESDDNDAGKCGLTLDEKYKKYNDSPAKEKEFNSKMITELEKLGNCKFLAALTRFALAFSDED